jgi:transposase-like protein
MSKELPSPQSLIGLQEMFPDERACEEYLIALRWPEPGDFECPACGFSEAAYNEGRRMLQCPNCRTQTYLTAGSIMEKSHTPLKTWFYAAYLVTTLTPGISAVQLQHQLGLKRYETAFQLLHKLRSAMANPDREPLHGEVEVDETFIGGDVGRGHAAGGRSPEGKMIVVGAVERRFDKVGKRAGRPFYAGRVRMRVIADTKADSLIPFVQDHVEEGSVIITDVWGGYNKLADRGYQHEPLVEGSPKRGSAILPIIHLEFSNLKTWLQGTHHGRVEEQHLQSYLNEFCFRHNRRFWRFSSFQTILRYGMKTGPQTYEKLYSAEARGEGVHLSGYEEEL